MTTRKLADRRALADRGYSNAQKATSDPVCDCRPGGDWSYRAQVEVYCLDPGAGVRDIEVEVKQPGGTPNSLRSDR